MIRALCVERYESFLHLGGKINLIGHQDRILKASNWTTSNHAHIADWSRVCARQENVLYKETTDRCVTFAYYTVLPEDKVHFPSKKSITPIAELTHIPTTAVHPTSSIRALAPVNTHGSAVEDPVLVLLLVLPAVP